MLKPGAILKFFGIIVLSAVINITSWLLSNNELYTGSYNGYNYSVLIMREPFKPAEGAVG